MSSFLPVIALLLVAAPLHAQTRFLAGGFGGFGANFPGIKINSCRESSGGGAHVGALTGMQRGRLALFVDGGIIAAGDDCSQVELANGPAAPDTSFQNSVDYPLASLGANLRFDVMRVSKATVHVRAGGGVFIPTSDFMTSSPAYLQLGSGVRFGAGRQKFGLELLYHQFEYRRTQIVRDGFTPETRSTPFATRTAHPVLLRASVEFVR